MGVSVHGFTKESMNYTSNQKLRNCKSMNRPKTGLFAEFMKAVEPQLRTPFIQRHRGSQLPSALEKMFGMISKRQMDEIVLHIDQDEEEHYTLRTCMTDQSFIVDTARLLVESFGGHWEAGFNVVLRVDRDGSGELKGFGADDSVLESILQIEIEDISEDQIPAFEANLRKNLTLARAMVLDFEEMTSGMERAANRFNVASSRDANNSERFREAEGFIEWLLADNFVFMGLVSKDGKFGFEATSCDEIWGAEPLSVWPDSAWGDFPVRARKSHKASPVHRNGQIDEIRIMVPDSNGTSELLVRGMFTYRAITQPSRHVPILRALLSTILAEDHSLPGSWRYKGIANAFDSLPTEFLFTASRTQVESVIARVLDAETERKVRVHISIADAEGKGFVLAAMPKCQYADGIIQIMEREMTRSTGATYIDQGVFVGRYGTVLVHFFLTGVRGLSPEAEEELRDTLTNLATPWARRFEEEIANEHGEELADQLHTRYRTAFDTLFMQRIEPARAAQDIILLEQLSDERGLIADIYLDSEERVNLRLFQSQNAMLSQLLPVLGNFGMVVQDQFSDFVKPLGGPDLTIDTFRLVCETDTIINGKYEVIEALEAVFSGLVEDDPVNSLVVGVGLPWKEVDLLRAMLGYSRQLGLNFTKQRAVGIMLHYPEIVGNLVRLFHAKFDPGLTGNRTKAVTEATKSIRESLKGVSNHDEDSLLRGILEQIQAALRTNFYSTDLTAHYISFKVDHYLLPSQVKSGLRYEIYVHHAEVEGCHLRGGKVARGGIRWSDRGDFRTEVMGLVRTQMVKNVLIVPVGAKGGFRLKSPSSDFGVRRAQADALYQIFIRGLLDLTDNYVKGKIVSRSGVVAHDGDDAYLVVAADKGTAHLSDTANKLSEEYGHWLGDAFASGGSHGYDHKIVGITARGGWQCVNRHFAEMGINPKTDTFTCVGVGDTGGDVFGNGVIEYKTMKLLGAFNHKHIFIDPDPDPAASYKERKRLFKVCKGWDHYNADLISEGGGVFDRKAKSIPLSEPMKKILGVLKDDLPPDTVIRLLIRAQVDLFWNGGIGTYVKASWESDRDAGDAANNNLRVNGNELRCRTVGEGGNLGFTHGGRVEFASKGGRINNDAVDNSGGVDMSDHEVNLKILLAEQIAKGLLSMDDRNQLIFELTGEITDQVLENNNVHGRQISLDQMRSSKNPFPFARAIQWVTDNGGFSPARLGLPDNDAISKRAVMQQGLTRPELAVLGAHVKLEAAKLLEDEDPTLIPGMADLIQAYFPPRVQAMYSDDIRGHMLATEIGFTVALNGMVVDAGAAAIPSLMDLTSRSVVEVLTCWYRIINTLDVVSLRNSIFASSASLDTQYQAWTQVVDGLLGLMAVLLGPGESPVTDEQMVSCLESYSNLRRRRGLADKSRFSEKSESLVRSGLSQALSDRVATVSDLTTAMETSRIRTERNESVRDAIVRYLSIGNASGLLPAIYRIESQRVSDQWEQLAVSILRSRYLGLMRTLVESTEMERDLKLGVDRASFRLSRGPMEEVRKVVDGIVGEGATVGALLVAEERIRAMVLK